MGQVIPANSRTSEALVRHEIRAMPIMY